MAKPWPWQRAQTGLLAGGVLLADWVPPGLRDYFEKKRTKRLLEHAIETIPAVALKLAGRPLASPPLLQDFPATTRAELGALPLLAHVSTTVSDPMLSDATSGSSGARVPVFRDHHDTAIGDAIWMRTYANLGWTPRMRRARLRHPDPATDHAPKRRLRAQLGLPQPVEISTALPVEAQTDALLRYCPELIHGSPHEIANVCQELSRRSIRLSSLCAVVCAGEPLHCDVAELIRDRLGVAPRALYGTAEAGLVAWTCQFGRFHLNSDVVLAELTGDGAGGRANLWLTTLLRRAMPLIRFAPGDVVLPKGVGQCACASTWPLFGDVLGAESSFLVLPDGLRIPERTVAETLAAHGGSHRFALSQSGHGPVLVHVLRDALSARDLRAMRHALHRLVDGRLTFEVRPASALPLGRTGKYALVRSNPASPA